MISHLLKLLQVLVKYSIATMIMTQVKSQDTVYLKFNLQGQPLNCFLTIVIFVYSQIFHSQTFVSQFCVL